MGISIASEAGNRIPVSLLTGFLGSGKTTLLNYLVNQPEMSNCIVVINEFGEIALDQHFIQKSDGDVVVLANGCMCCSMQGDFETIVGALFAKRNSNDMPEFDRLLVETTGLADPTSIMQVLFTSPLITKRFYLEAVVTTVDAVNCPRQLNEHDEARKQVAVADRIIITKVDLIDPGAADSLSDRLSKINPTAAIFRVSHGRVAPAVLFGASSIDPLSPARESQAKGKMATATQYAHMDHLHDRDIISFTLVFNEPLQWNQIYPWLNRLKIRHSDQLLRVKGILNVLGEDAPIAIHGVHHVFHPPVRLPPRRDGDLNSYIVFVTRGLSRDEILANWGAFQASSSSQLHQLFGASDGR